MDIRAATADDVEAVVALVESAYRGDASRAGWTTEADLLDGQRTDADGVREVVDDLLVAEDHSGLLACCVLDDAGHFGMFAVRPGQQGQGVGTALLDHAEAAARAAGLAALEMQVLSLRAELLAFYERRGYVRTGATAPFPYGDERFGLPRRDDLEFLVLRKAL